MTINLAEANLKVPQSDEVMPSDEVIKAALAARIDTFLNNPLRAGHSIAGIFFHQNHEGTWKANFCTQKSSTYYAWEGDKPIKTGRRTTELHNIHEVLWYEDSVGGVTHVVDPIRNFAYLFQIGEPALIQVRGNSSQVVEGLLSKGTIIGPRNEHSTRQSLHFLYKAFRLVK